MRKRGEAVLRIARLRTWLVLPALVLGFGCAGPKGDVSGKVTYLGKPLPAGTVTFFGPEDRVVGSSQVSAAGEYKMTKVPPGSVKITVTVPPTIRDPSVPPSKGGKKKEKDPAEEQHMIHLDVPAKYRFPNQSDLTYTVQPGPQEHSIDLK